MPSKEHYIFATIQVCNFLQQRCNEDNFELPEGAGMMENEDFSDTVFKVCEEKEIGRQGLKKLLVKEGERWETPETSDEVEGILTHDL